jgi:pSer/pThr/pTyr-binding forkhead associated (FHA) protein
MTPERDGTSTPEEPVEIATRAVQARGSNVGLHAVVLSGSAKGTVIPIGETFRVGKAPDNHLVLADDTVSRHHCELYRVA